MVGRGRRGPEGEPAQEAVAVPMTVEDSAAVAPHGAIDPDREIFRI